MDVDAHPQHKYCHTQYCPPEWRSNVVLIGNALQVPVGEGEGESREQYFEGHFCGWFKSPRVDDVSVDIVEDEEHVRQREFVAEVGCPEQVGHFEEKPSELGTEVDVGEGRLEAAVIDFDASEDKPADDRVAHDDVEADGFELHLIGNL